jgi:hypothetical protein
MEEMPERSLSARQGTRILCLSNHLDSNRSQDLSIFGYP